MTYQVAHHIEKKVISRFSLLLLICRSRFQHFRDDSMLPSLLAPRHTKGPNRSSPVEATFRTMSAIPHTQHYRSTKAPPAVSFALRRFGQSHNHDGNASSSCPPSINSIDPDETAIHERPLCLEYSPHYSPAAPNATCQKPPRR